MFSSTKLNVFRKCEQIWNVIPHSKGAGIKACSLCIIVLSAFLLITLFNWVDWRYRQLKFPEKLECNIPAAQQSVSSFDFLLHNEACIFSWDRFGLQAGQSSMHTLCLSSHTVVSRAECDLALFTETTNYLLGKKHRRDGTCLFEF